MSFYAIPLSMALYSIIAIDNFIKKDYSHALIWFSYALSQVGFLWYEFSKISLDK